MTDLERLTSLSQEAANLRLYLAALTVDAEDGRPYRDSDLLPALGASIRIANHLKVIADARLKERATTA